MNSHNYKQITFVYKDDQYFMQVNASIPLRDFVDQIKTYFNIEPDENVAFINAKTEMGLAPAMAIDFWEFSTDEVPVYRIKTSNSEKSAGFSNKRRLCFLDNCMKKEPGPCESFLINYILPLISK